MKRNLIIEKKVFISEEDANLLWRLMPNWLRNPSGVGGDPTFYGTGSHRSDVNMQKKIRKILFNESN